MILLGTGEDRPLKVSWVKDPCKSGIQGGYELPVFSVVLKTDPSLCSGFDMPFNDHVLALHGLKLYDIIRDYWLYNPR